MLRPIALSLTTFLLLVSRPLSAADGDLDPTFWGDGKFALSASVDLAFGGMAATANEEVALAYHLLAGDRTRAYWRAVSDSTLGPFCRVNPDSNPDLDQSIQDVAFDSSGRLLVAMASRYEATLSAWLRVMAFHFPDCILDDSFGGDGIVTLPGWTLATHHVYRLVPLNDGRIVLAGTGVEDPDAPQQQSRILRLESDGALDTTFSADGVAFGREGRAGSDVAVSPDGQLLMVETAGPDFSIERFSADGDYLETIAIPFDLGGNDDDRGSSIAALPDGRFVVVGTASGPGWLPVGSIHSYAAIALLKWDENGALVLDPAFSDDGKLAFVFGSERANSLSDVVLQGSNRIVVAGSAHSFGSPSDMAVARLTLEGTFDPEFYPPGDGQRLIAFDVASPERDFALRLALQSGRPVLAGRIDIDNDVTSLGIARLEDDLLWVDGFDLSEVLGWDPSF